MAENCLKEGTGKQIGDRTLLSNLLRIDFLDKKPQTNRKNQGKNGKTYAYICTHLCVHRVLESERAGMSQDRGSGKEGTREIVIKKDKPSQANLPF